MKNFKKLFAVVASVMMLASTVPTAILGVAAYDEDTTAAYQFAFDNGITTKDTIEAANVNGTLIRTDMAKMMVNYAKEVLGKTETFNAEDDCAYTDIANQTTNAKDYIVEACMMGLMGVDNEGVPTTTFNPLGTVSRAMFATILSRVLYGNANNGGTPYYADHMAALNDAGIMNDLTNPERALMRGHAMIMMMRAAEGNTNPAICETPENTLACSLGLDTCPAECQTVTPDVVKAGSLSVKLGDNTPADMTSVPKAGTVLAASLDLKAGSNDVSVNSFELAKVGLGTRSNISKLYFEKDGVRVSSRASLTSDGKATVSFSPAFVVKAGSTETIDLMVVLVGTTAGDEYAFKFNDADTTAESVSMNVTTPTLKTVSYTVGQVTFATGGTNSTMNVGDKDVELGKFTLSNGSADDKEVNVKSLTFKNIGNGDISNSLTNLNLYRNGTKVSTDTIINGKEITFPVSTKLTANQLATFYIRGDVDAVETTAADTYRFQLTNSDAFNAVEDTTNFRVNLTNATYPLIMATSTIAGGTITFTKDATLSSSQTVAPATTSVVILKGKITTKEAIDLEDLQIPVTSTVSGLNQIVSKFTLKIGNSTSTYTPTTGGLTETIEFDGSWNITSSATVEITADIKSTATAGTVKFDNLARSQFVTTHQYVSTQNDITASDVVGSIASSTLNISAAKLNLTRTDGLSNRNIVKGANGVTLYAGKFSSTDTNYINISSFTLSGTNDAADFNNLVSTTLYVNDVPVKTQNVSSSNVVYSSLNIKVKNGEDANIKILGNINSSVATDKVLGFTVKSVSATDNNSQTVGASLTSQSATITMVAAGSIEVVKNTSAVTSSLLTAGSTDVELAKLNIIAKDDTTRLTDLYFKNGSSLDLTDRVNSAKLYLADGTFLANGSIFNDGSDDIVAFENLNGTNFQITPETIKTLVVKASLNAVTNTGDLASPLIKLSLGRPAASYYNAGTTSQGLRLISESNGDVVSTTTVSVAAMANESKVVKGAPVITQLTTSPTSTRVMEFKIAANGNRITLSGLNVSAAGISGTATLNIYKDSVSTANRIYQNAAFADGDTTVVLSTQVEIAAGSEQKFIVELASFNPTLVGTSLYKAREFKINDVNYLDMFQNGNLNYTTVSAYTNVGNLPLVETYRP